MIGRAAIASALAAALCTAAALGQRPDTSAVFPAGGQRGTEVEIGFTGRYLFDPNGVMVRPAEPVAHQAAADGAAPPAIPEEPIAVLSVEGNERGTSATVRLRIDGDAPLGLYSLRLRTAHGIGPLHLFHVGPLEELREAETRGKRLNDLPDQAEPIPLERTVNGEIDGIDTDCYAFEVAVDTVVRCEVQAVRLGGSPRDLAFTVRDPEGQVVLAVDDTAFGTKDPVGWFTATMPGPHTLELTGAVPLERSRRTYRLHVGTFPRPVAAHPLGGRPGQTLELVLAGDPEMDTATVHLPVAGGEIAYFPTLGGRTAPIPLMLHVVGLGPPAVATRPDVKGQAVEGQAVDGQGADEAAPPPLHQVPGILDGVLAEPGAIDSYWFPAKRNERWNLRLRSRQFRSPLDGEIAVYDQRGRYVTGNDDGRGAGADPALTFRAPADGEYRIDVRDLLRRGGSDYTYRLEVRAAGGSSDRYGTRLNVPATGGDETLAVPRGGHRGHVLVVNGFDRDDPIAAAIAGLPPGVTAELGHYRKDTPYVPVVLSAAEDAPLGGSFALPQAATGRHPGYLQRIPMVRTRNNLPYLQRFEDGIPIAVTEPPPFAVHFEPLAVPVVRGSFLAIPITVTRAEGFTGAVRVSMLWTPPGLSAGATTIASGKDKGTLYLGARGNAKLATWPIAVAATATVRGGRHEVASAMRAVRVEAPWVTASGGNLRLDQGAAGVLLVTLKWRRPDELADGPITAYLNGLPKGITADKPTVEPGTEKLEFAIQVSPKCAPGRYRPNIRLTLPTADGEVLHRDYGAEVRVDPATDQ